MCITKTTALFLQSKYRLQANKKELDMQLVTIHITKNLSKEAMEIAFGAPLQRGVEHTLVAKIGEGSVMATKFGTISFMGMDSEGIARLLGALRLKNADAFEEHYIFQDYSVVLDESLEMPFKVTNSEVVLRNSDDTLLSIIALVVSQSVGLEKFEQSLDDKLAKTKFYLKEEMRFSIAQRKKLLAFASNLASLRQDLIVDLYLLDKPNITWDDEVAEHLYNKLSDLFELKDRFTITEYKLTLIRDEISFMMDVINHKNSEFLEIIIIVLIAFEIVMGLYQMIKN
jgi:required for meiotic nuclear division protein 1